MSYVVHTAQCPDCGTSVRVTSETAACPVCGAPLHGRPAAPPAPSQTPTTTPPDGVTTLPCPRCETFLFEARSGELVIDGCGVCGGIWVDSPGCAALVQRAVPGVVALADLAARRAVAVVDVQASAACPQCRTAMRRVHDVRSRVDLDVCAAHGTWFDSRELHRVSLAHGLARRPAQPDDRPLSPSEIPDFRVADGNDDLTALLGALRTILGAFSSDD